jgi:CRISPR/Cas system-associated endonuclease Cas1
LYKAKLALDDDARLKVVRKMYAIRFGEPAPLRRSIEQLRGIEGARVRAMYQMLARKYGVEWDGRDYDHTDWNKGDIPMFPARAGMNRTVVRAPAKAPNVPRTRGDESAHTNRERISS